MSNAQIDRKLQEAPPFNPDELFSEVHGHKTYCYKQNGFYYDARGAAVAKEPPAPKITLGIRKLKRGVDANKRKTAGAMPNTINRIIGKQNNSTAASIAKAQIENAQSLAAEQLE